jgi:ABC-type oligopeptide transport system substrate-binding subunit
MMMKNKFVICSVLIIILTAIIVSTGCTSTQTQTSAQSNSPTITTPSQTFSPTTVPETLITTLAPTTAPTAILSTTATPTNSGLTVTLNSAEKKTSLGNGIGKPGRMLLIVDITIKNNDKKNDFKYTDASFVISYKSNSDRLTAITTQYANNRGLINPLISGTVAAGSTDDGTILFGVNSTSNSYKLSVVDSTGTLLTSVDNIYVP